MFKASCSSSTLEFYFGILSLYFSFMFYWVRGGLWAVWIFHIKRKLCYIQSGSFHVQPQWPETEIQPYFSSVVCFRKYSKAYKNWSNKTVLIIKVFLWPSHLSGSKCFAVTTEWVLPCHRNTCYQPQFQVWTLR